MVSVSSNTHTLPIGTESGVPFSLEELNDKSTYDSLHQYGMTKLCNILFAKEVDRRYYEKGIISNAVHPGGVDSSFLDQIFSGGKQMEGNFNLAFKLLHIIAPYLFWKSDIAALSIVGSAVKPLGHGIYTIPIHRAMTPTKQAQDMQSALKLWQFSEKLCAV